MSRLAKGLVLASGSASRRNLLKTAGVDFLADPADLDEAALMADLAARGADAARGGQRTGGAKGAMGIAAAAPAGWCWAATV